MSKKEKQQGIQGQWQRASPVREYLEQVKSCNDTDCTPRTMKQAFFAFKRGDWEEYKRTFRIEATATEWAFDRIREAFEHVAKDEVRKLSTMQEIMTISTDNLRRIIAPAGGQGVVTTSYLCPHCNGFPIEDYVWWVSGEKKHTNWWCAMCGGKYEWRAPNRILVVETDESVSQAKVFKAHAVPQGSCGNLINALKLLADQQERGWWRPHTEHCY